MAIRILLAEDNPGDARLLREILDDNYKIDFEFSHVICLQDAITEAASNHYDIFLLDLCLPDYSGLDTVTKAYDELPDLPIIVLSGADDEGTAISAVQLGAQDYLVKGQIDAGIVSRTIRYAIQRSQIQKALRESRERYALAVEGARDGIWDWDLNTNRIYFSPRWKAMLNYKDDEIGDHPDEWLDRVHPEDLTQLISELDAHQKNRSKYFENEHRIQIRGGEYRWMLTRGVAVCDDGGKAYRMAGSLTDISERHHAEEQLLYKALHDALTNLPNRTYFMRLLQRALAKTKNYEDNEIAVLFIDIDRYKVVNDSLGHLVGDQLLIGVARRLERCLRPGDSVARLGGDEFTVFLDNINGVRDTTYIADRILKKISKPFIIGGHEIFITGSIGIVLSSSGYNQPEDMLRDADLAMYQAKSKGKDRFEIFDMDMHTKAVAQMSLEMDMRYAIERQAFDVYYQPIISLLNGQITGFEALARWHKNGGYISPDQFIPAAEESGLISAIGEQVMRAACRQLRDWQQQGLARNGVNISINFSGKQFAQADIVHRIKDILDETSLQGRYLQIEITESAILENSKSLTRNLAMLKDLGITISMDDFGTGYASLSNLYQLPFDNLKVDRSFISGNLQNSKDQKDKVELIRTIISMAHNLGISVIAEGVETEELLQHLQNFNCEYAQGYYFSPAVNKDAAGQLLRLKPSWDLAKK